MHLNQQDSALFYKLWYGLVWGINERHKIIPWFKKPVYGTRVTVSIQEFIKVRNQMWDHPQWIDELLSEADGGGFTEQEQGIIATWQKHFVKEEFLVAKHLARYSVLMNMRNEPNILYGVCGITDDIKDTFPQPVPFIMKAVLLPFRDIIIYDSLAESYDISFGVDLLSAAKEWYDVAKGNYGIVETLNGEPLQLLPSAQRKKEGPARETSSDAPNTVAAPPGVGVPKAMTERYNEIAEIIARFCNEKLNEEYEKISLYALAKLCRKRPSPLLTGKARTWACGIVYAIGSTNFIFDKTQPVHMTASEIAGWFGLAPSTRATRRRKLHGFLIFLTCRLNICSKLYPTAIPPYG